MEEKMLNKVNAMAKETKAQYDRYGRDELYIALYNQLLGALHLLKEVTGKDYVIEADGTVKEV